MLLLLFCYCFVMLRTFIDVLFTFFCVVCVRSVCSLVCVLLCMYTECVLLPGICQCSECWVISVNVCVPNLKAICVSLDIS
jgi:hypothetical protein